MIDLALYGSCVLSDDGCTTCGDVAVPVRVLAIGADGTGTCKDRLGAKAEIQLDFTPGVSPGDVVMVHMGIAIAKVDPSGAAAHPTESRTNGDVAGARPSETDPKEPARR